MFMGFVSIGIFESTMLPCFVIAIFAKYNLAHGLHNAKKSQKPSLRLQTPY
jgi:hypothetical protein